MLNFYRNLHFYTPAEHLPPTSGQYLTFSRGGNTWISLPYSAKHKRFNAYDSEETPEYPIEVTYWAECPKMPGEADEEQ